MVPVIPGKLAIVTAQSSETTLATNMNLWIAVGIPLVIWLLAIATMWIGLERLVLRWLFYLRRVGTGYARGHYVVMPRYAENAPAEFEQLARTLSQMALTARARQRDLRAALEQKNVLVREIHHRVKNNLQIIQSLLNLQSRSASDSNQFTALAAAKSRISALALVHQSLYEDENLQFVNMQTFLDELCRHLLQTGWGAAKRVGITIDVPEVLTTADQAVPIALLVTEAVTNSLKHAFFGRDNGAITVRLVNDPTTGAELTVRDNGIGMETGPRPKVKPGSGGGIGYSLIEGFARQLRGTVETIVNDGTCVCVKFPYLAGRKAA
jgi:two-component sensor histidine kinase